MGRGLGQLRALRPDGRPPIGGAAARGSRGAPPPIEHSTLPSHFPPRIPDERPPVQSRAVQVVGGDPSYEEQEDGSQALLMPENSYLKLSLPQVPSRPHACSSL